MTGAIALRDRPEAASWRLRAQIMAHLVAVLEPETAIDPAAGDGSVLREAHQLHTIQVALLGDASIANAEHMLDISAAIDTFVTCGSPGEILAPVKEIADVIVLTEVLGRIDDPEELLRQARITGRNLVVSALPDETGYTEMFLQTGWSPLAFIPTPFFKFWVCG